MGQRIPCPGCNRVLLAPDSARGSTATCPRCLAAVSVPETPRGPDAVQAERPEQHESSLSCPRCGRAVEAVWLACPWCDEPLRGRREGGYGRADLDVRRDTRRTSVVLIFLAVIGVLGVALLGWQAFVVFVASQGYEYQPMLFLAVGLLFLAGLSTAIVYLRSGGNPGAGGVRRVVVGTLAMAGGAMLLGVCTGLALFVFLLAVCLSGNGPKF